MKGWQWVLVAGVAIVVIIIIMRSDNATPINGELNAESQAAAGIGGLLSGLFKGSNTTSKITATSAGNIAPGGINYDTPIGSTDYGATTASSGAAYSSAMQSTGYAASESAGSGGTSSGGGLTGAQASNSAGDPLGLGTLTSPNFDVGTGGADFSN